jgi:glycosyltransferase involved in cell wall biosynthesis
MKNKTISVCMATYNGEKYIREQLLSILKQLGPQDEIIVSDDHSKDKTISILEEFKDDRIKIFFNENKGHTKNFENAVKNASGDYIFLSDQDDVWEENKISVMTCFLKDFDFVVSDAKIVNENLESLGSTYFELRGGGKNGFWNNLLKARYLGCCMAFRKKILQKALPFPDDVVHCPHDLWLSLLAEFYYKTYVVRDSLILYRRHGENVSTGGAKSANSGFFKAQFRLYSFFKVLSRIKE